MDDQAMKTIKNIEKYTRDIKSFDGMLNQLVENTSRIATSIENLEKMMEQSWSAYANLVEVGRRQKKRKTNDRAA